MDRKYGLDRTHTPIKLEDGSSVYICKRENEVLTGLSALMSSLDDCKIIGLDTERIPTNLPLYWATRIKLDQNEIVYGDIEDDDIRVRKLSEKCCPVIQLGTSSVAVIVQLCYFDAPPSCLIDFLSQTDLLFAGAAIQDDVKILTKDGLVCHSFIDIGQIAQWVISDFHSVHNLSVGLKSLADHFEIPIAVPHRPSKNERTDDVMRNWGAPVLDDLMVIYASNDAMAPPRLMKAMIEKYGFTGKKFNQKFSASQVISSNFWNDCFEYFLQNRNEFCGKAGNIKIKKRAIKVIHSMPEPSKESLEIQKFLDKEYEAGRYHWNTSDEAIRAMMIETDFMQQSMEGERPEDPKKGNIQFVSGEELPARKRKWARTNNQAITDIAITSNTIQDVLLVKEDVHMENHAFNEPLMDGAQSALEMCNRGGGSKRRKREGEGEGEGSSQNGGLNDGDQIGNEGENYVLLKDLPEAVINYKSLKNFLCAKGIIMDGWVNRCKPAVFMHGRVKCAIVRLPSDNMQKLLLDLNGLNGMSVTLSKKEHFDSALSEEYKLQHNRTIFDTEGPSIPNSDPIPRQKRHRRLFRNRKNGERKYLWPMSK